MRLGLFVYSCLLCFLFALPVGQCSQSSGIDNCEVSGLLQLQVQAASIVPQASQDSAAQKHDFLEGQAHRLEKIKPVAFFHVPKAGSTFFNVLYNHPAICALAPKGVAMGKHTLLRHPPEKLCEGGWSTSYAAVPHSQLHFGVSPYNWQRNKGHFVTMMRQPEQRLLSHWHYSISHPGFAQGNASNIRDFAKQMQGCAVKMLTEKAELGSLASPCFNVELRPTMAMANEAVQRLREGFAFVGLTDKWQLSICLFHAMYGAKCNDVEFQDVNRQRQNSTWDAAGLNDFHDPFDGLLYEEAQRIFHKNLNRYGVSEENCPSLCM